MGGILRRDIKERKESKAARYRYIGRGEGVWEGEKKRERSSFLLGAVNSR